MLNSCVALSKSLQKKTTIIFVYVTNIRFEVLWKHKTCVCLEVNMKVVYLHIHKPTLRTILLILFNVF